MPSHLTVIPSKTIPSKRGNPSGGLAAFIKECRRSAHRVLTNDSEVADRKNTGDSSARRELVATGLSWMISSCE